MDLRQLRYFAALAEHLSFTVAASSVHVSQSTLSHQIKNLEDELGCQLFDRTSRTVQLTEKGSALLPHAVQLLQGLDDALRSLQAQPPRLEGKFRIGVITTVHLALAVALTRTVLSQFPQAAIEVLELSGEELNNRLLDNNIEMGIGYRPQNPEVDFDLLYSDELTLAVGRQHPLANRKRIRLATLHGQRIAILKNPETRHLLYEYLAPAKAQPTIVAECNRVPMLLLLASSTDIGAIVTRRSAESFPNLIAIALEQPAPFLQFGLLRKKDRQTDAGRVIAAIAHEIAKSPLAIRFGQLGITGVDSQGV